MAIKNFAAAAAIATVFAAPLSAATTIYTDRASFNNAVLQSDFVDFNDVPSQVNFRTSPFDAGPFTLQGSGSGQGTRNFIDIQPLQFNTFNVDGTTVANLLANGNSSVTFTFDNPITAFGADFGSINDEVLRTQLNTGSDIVTPVVTPVSAVQFFGFTSDTAFTSLVFESAAPNGDGFSVDNVSIGAAVPEPATWAMMLLGLFGLGGLMRRRGKSDLSAGLATA
ncbi:MAG: PEPxxWA-CTERM sorting domain-containing protein [Pseudomonadota bacterium]